MKYFLIYSLFCFAFFNAMNQGLSKSLLERCNAGLVPIQYCQK